MKGIKALLIILLAGMAALPSHTPVKADAAPPANPPGGDVSPEGQTQVQMVAEEVIFDFRQSTDDSAQVSAWFLFHNTGEVDEHLKVRFPLNGDRIDMVDPSTGKMKPAPLVQDFAAFVGGEKLQTQIIKDENQNAQQYFLGYSTIIYWSVFEMDFPAGKDVKLAVNYSYQPAESQYSPNAQLFYILATGAGWKGPIGKADLIFRFPYELNEINGIDLEFYRRIYKGVTFAQEENDIHIHWNDLEPTDQDNVTLYVLQPRLWQEILRRRLEVIAAPSNATSWKALARAYAAASVEKHGFFYNENVNDLYIHACEEALSLDFQDVAFHMEFATNMFHSPIYGYQETDSVRALVRNELSIVFQLDPNNQDAAALYQQLDDSEKRLMTNTGSFPPLPTYTPTSTVTITPTVPPSSTATIAPTKTRILTQTPQPTGTTVLGNTASSVSSPVKPARNTGWLFPILGFVLLAGAFTSGWIVRGRKK